MMKIQTGKGTISIFTLIAIWSISLVVNLPGLAISPILSDMQSIFPGTSQLEIQLLEILPNLFIIPFVVLSGRLSVSKSKIFILTIALVIYLASGILYFFASSMIELIIISCLLGIGCGLVIPLAAGLLADFFVGKYRMQQLGIKSGIANISLVLATLAVGIIGDKNWHLPFLVYLIPVIPLLLTPLLWKEKGKSVDNQINSKEVVGTLDKRKLIGISLLYGFVSYAVIVMSYYLPFLAQNDKISNSALGTITACFFLAIMFPGFALPYIVKIFKQYTSLAALIMMALGLLLVLISHQTWLFAMAAICAGLGYGTLQPIIYDKATETATGGKATLALAVVLSMNYVAVTLAPFIVDLFKLIFHTESNLFPFLLNLIMVLGCIIVNVKFRKSFTFNINQDYI